MPEPKVKKPTKPRTIKPRTTDKSKSVKPNLLAWFEIPVLNFERAMAFYSSVFNIRFETMKTPTHAMAFFPESSGTRGALVYGDGCTPNQTGALLYFDTGPNLESTLNGISEGGGQVLMGKTLISDDFGHYALVLDSEGNRIALYSNSNT